MLNVAKTHPLPVPSFGFSARVADFQHSYSPPPTWRAHLAPIPKRSVDYHYLAKVEHNLAHGKLKDATELARMSVSAVINYSKAPAPGIEEDEYTEAI